VGENSITIDNTDDLHHMLKVLRLSEGDKIEISDGMEWEYEAEILYLSRERAEARILDKQRFTSESHVKITLFQGIPKQSKMDTIVQKAVEFGVFRISPVFTARTVVTDNGNFSKKVQRWRRISAEAVKQCKRGIIPEVTEPCGFTELLGALEEFDLVLIPYENEDGVTLKDELRKFRQKQGEASRSSARGSSPEYNHLSESGGLSDNGGDCRIALIIGPEGGFSDEEVRLVTAAGGKSVSLGKRILRTETAGIAAVAMIMYELEL